MLPVKSIDVIFVAKNADPKVATFGTVRFPESPVDLNASYSIVVALLKSTVVKFEHPLKHYDLKVVTLPRFIVVKLVQS